MFNASATIGAQFIYLEARRQAYKRGLKMISTAEVGTVFQFSRGLNQYAIKCSRRGEAEGFVEVIIIVGRDLYTVLQVSTEELKLLPNQEQYKGTPLVKHLENFLKGCHSNYNTTAPVGTIYTVGLTGSLVIKCNANGDPRGLVEVLTSNGDKFTFEASQLTKADVSAARQALLIQILNQYQRACIPTSKGTPENGKSDGSTASYYQLPPNSTELQDLISHRNMNAQMGEIFRATYRFGMASHSDQLRDAKKIKFYIEAEIKRLESQCNK